MDPDKVRELLQEGRLHLSFVCSLYRRQLARGKHFLHEHPASAMSWNEDAVKALGRDPTVRIVTADQCQYGLVTPSAKDKTKMVPAMKPTKFMTNSVAMASQLQQRCKRDHEHQHLVGNRCRDAAFYPDPLVKAIIRAMSLSENGRESH